MSAILSMMTNNRIWADAQTAAKADYFPELASGQTPQVVWIGCADSRVPPNLVTGTGPGDLFVHRNVANMVAPNDLNLMSVLQYAIDALKAPHIVICGHEGCGGIGAVVDEAAGGLLDHWLDPARDIGARHAAEISALPDRQSRVNRLVELNVRHQVVRLGRVKLVRDAWARGQELTIHGWVFALSDGRIRELDTPVSSRDEVEARASAL